MDEDERWLRASFAAARAAVAGGDQPYGAVLVGASGRLLAEAGNSIASGADCTAHAELNLIRGLGARPGQLKLEDQHAGMAMDQSIERQLRPIGLHL